MEYGRYHLFLRKHYVQSPPPNSKRALGVASTTSGPPETCANTPTELAWASGCRQACSDVMFYWKLALQK